VSDRRRVRLSRFTGGWMIPSRQAHDVLSGHLDVLSHRALPRRVVWDQEGAIGRWHGSKMAVTSALETVNRERRHRLNSSEQAAEPNGASSFRSTR
jgi:hypothetical protein